MSPWAFMSGASGSNYLGMTLAEARNPSKPPFPYLDNGGESAGVLDMDGLDS